MNTYVLSCRLCVIVIIKLVFDFLISTNLFKLPILGCCTGDDVSSSVQCFRRRHTQALDLA